MSYWDSIKEYAVSAMDNVKKGANYAADKAGEFGRIGVLKVEIANIKGRINKSFLNLGSDVFILIQEKGDTNIAENEQVKAYIDEILKAKGEIEAKEAEIKKLSEQEDKSF